MKTPPAVTTIWRILTRAGLITPNHANAHAAPTHDLKLTCPTKPAIRLHPLAPSQRTRRGTLLWLDDHSRFLISATAHKPVTGAIVLTTFRAACATYGTPQSTLTDNGFVFTTRHRGGANAFEIELLNLSVHQKRTETPNHPQTQGKVERLNQTLKRWLTARPRASNLTELQHQLNEFTDYYNTRRPHRALNRKPPPRPTQPEQKPSPTTTQQDTSASATTPSTQQDQSPCDEEDACTTSNSAWNTQAHPSACSSK